MAKITLNNIVSGFASQSLLDSNFDAIESEFNGKVLYRDNPAGEANQMENVLDMNSKSIINLPSATSPTEPATYGQLSSAASNVQFTGTSVETLTATAAQTLFTLMTTTYTPGAANLVIHINGIRQEPRAYIETSTSVVTFTEGLEAGDSVLFTINERQVDTDTVPGTSVTVTVDGVSSNAQNEIARLDRLNHDTVADMDADTGLTVGDIIQTGGYTVKGDGGDNLYEVVAASTGTDDGGSFIDLSGSGLQAKGLFPRGIINITQFGAVANDDTADSQPAIAAAMAYAVRGRVNVTGKANTQNTIYYLASTLEVPQHIHLAGESRGGTRLYAKAGFTDPYLVRLGEPLDVQISGCTATDLTIDASVNLVTGVIAGYSNSINESSGFRDCSLVSDNSSALIISTEGGGVPINFELERNSCITYNTDGTTNVVILNTGHIRLVKGMTIVGDGFGGGTEAAVGLLLKGGLKANIVGIHGEGCDDLIVVGDGSGGGQGGCQSLTISGVTGPSAGSGPIINLVKLFNTLENRNITLNSLDKRSATNVLKDDINAVTLADEGLALYALGQGGSGKKPILSTSTSIKNILPTYKKIAGERALLSRSNATTYTINHDFTFYEGRNNTITATIADFVDADKDVVEFKVVHNGTGTTTIQPTTDQLYDETGALQASILLANDIVYTVRGVLFGGGARWYLSK